MYGYELISENELVKKYSNSELNTTLEIFKGDLKGFKLFHNTTGDAIIARSKIIEFALKEMQG